MVKKDIGFKGLSKLKPKKIGLLYQVLLLFIFIAIGVGVFTYYTEYVFTGLTITKQTEEQASHTADEIIEAVKEYPAYRWLVDYWYKNSDTMDVEYDVEFVKGTRTEKKLETLLSHEPDLRMRYADQERIERMSAEDQKLYAEITYSWTITRLNQIKQANNVAFLFCVMTGGDYTHQFFLLSGADKGAVRGTAYEEIYTLGVEKDVAETQQIGMKKAKETSRHLVDAGDYMDYYAYIDTIDEKDLVIGLTFDLTEINKDIKDRTFQATLIAVIIELILAWVCLTLIYNVVIKPVGSIQHSIRLYMRNKDSDEVSKKLHTIKSANEIGQLSRDVTDMTKEIDSHVERISAITKEKERINAELDLATRIQDNMLPNIFPAFPERHEFDIYASMEPARDVGGDFYNFFFVDDDHLCLLIADVSGKGIPAAMFMMASQIIISNNVSSGKTPAKAMEDTNNMLCSNNEQDMFVTVWLGILDIRTGVITAVNAGHEYPVIGHKDGRFELIKDKHGMIVGGMEGIKYKEYELKLDPGEKIFVYTDGVPEATDKDNVQFGVERMIEALDKGAESPEQVLANVRASVGEFVGDAEQFDDLTMLCLEYKGQGSS